MSGDRREQFRRDLLHWAEDNLRVYPWREPDASLYEVFIAEFFLTQTPADNVDNVYPDFLERFPSLNTIETADRDEVEEVIEPLGFHKMRSEALTKIASRYTSLPDTEAELLELPRVGPYVANATLCFALGRPRPILDRNVVRVYDRVFTSEFPDSEAEQQVFTEQMLPEAGLEARTYNLALLDFGAMICVSGDPRCEACFASDYCEYYQVTK